MQQPAPEAVQTPPAEAGSSRSREGLMGSDASRGSGAPGSTLADPRADDVPVRFAAKRALPFGDGRGVRRWRTQLRSTSVHGHIAHTRKLAPAVVAAADSEASTLDPWEVSAARSRQRQTLNRDQLAMERARRVQQAKLPVKDFDHIPRSSPSRCGSWCTFTGSTKQVQKRHSSGARKG